MPRKKKLNPNENPNGAVPGDIAPKQPKKQTPKKGKVTQQMVSGLVQMVNMPLIFVAPDYSLSNTEMMALTVAMTDLAEQNQFVGNLIYNMMTATRMTEVPIVVGAIFVNKMIVAGKIPDAMQAPANALLEGIASRYRGNVPEPEPVSRNHHKGKDWKKGKDNPADETDKAGLESDTLDVRDGSVETDTPDAVPVEG